MKMTVRGERWVHADYTWMKDDLEYFLTMVYRASGP
jgi:hypothetical protein